MSHECNPCHVIATGTDARYVHLTCSYGPCETCHKVNETYECQCSGDWVRARERNSEVVSFNVQHSASDNKFRVGVITVAGATPAYNALVFDTRKEATDYAHDLMRRWTAVISTVVEEVPTSPEEGA